MKQVGSKLLGGILALCGLMLATPSRAQFTIDFDAVIDFDIGFANVDIVNSPTPPTHVSLVNGGIMYNVYAYGVTEFTMTGGSSGNLRLYDNSRVDMTGGTLNGTLILNNNSRAAVTGTDGSLVRTLLYNDAEASVTLPEAKGVIVGAYGNSKFTLTGGTLNLVTGDNATCVVNYSALYTQGLSYFTASGTSHLTFHGGYYQLNTLSASEQSVVRVTGGYFEYYLIAQDAGTLYAQGGTFGRGLQLYQNAVAHVSGGSFGDGLAGITLYHSGVLHVYGNNLTYNAFRRLQGTLLNGTAINKTIAIVDPSASNPPRVVLHNYPVLNATLSGTIALEDCVNSAQAVTFVFARGSSALPYERTVTLDSNGGYTLPDVPGDAFEVRIKGAKWLAKKQALNINAATVTLNATLLAGDADNSNIVDVDDLSALIASFDADPTLPNWNGGVADFDCNDIVDVEDLSLLIRNFDKEGDA